MRSAPYKAADARGAAMTNYVDPTEQLVVELYVRDLGRSVAFYERLGFRVLRREPDFAELGWEDSRLFVEEVRDLREPACPPVSNVRIMVPDVDRYWQLAAEMDLPVIHPIADRYYGLRDFTVLGPDGVALRFASNLGT
jgi:catechol 2,3-dioxygenase-like lactoylglutathione lyase family enzyme